MQSAASSVAAARSAAPQHRLTATGTAPAQVQRTGASREIATPAPATRTIRTVTRRPRRPQPGRAGRAARPSGRSRPDRSAGSGARRSPESLSHRRGQVLLPVTITRAGPVGGSPASSPAHEAAAAPSTVIPSSSVSSAWAACSAPRTRCACRRRARASARPRAGWRPARRCRRRRSPPWRVDRAPGAPAQRHRRRLLGLDADDAAARRGVPQPRARRR